MSEEMLYIGVAGTAGAGKDTASDMIARLFNARNISSSDAVRAVTRHIYDLPADFNPVRDQLYQVANFLRNDVDPAFTVKVCMFKAEATGVKRALISGLRSMGEADAIRAKGGIIIGVDADPHVRYERMNARGRDAEAQKTFDQFLEQDTYENKGLSETGPGRGIRYIIDSADVVIDNNGTLEELEDQMRKQLQVYFNSKLKGGHMGISPQNLESMLAAYKTAIDSDISTYAVHAIKAAGEQYGSEAAETTAAYLDVVMRGGKRLRGALTMIGYEMLGGTDEQMITRAATALEMIHAYMLILDDIQDRSTLRRGKPALHVMLMNSKLTNGDPHVGMSLALNAALAGGHAAQMLLAGLTTDPELVRKVIGIVNLTMVVTNHGQNYDLIMEHGHDVLPSDAELENLLQWKTAEYTFLNPLCVGMVLAGAPCEDTNAIREYAIHAGKAFQLADDIRGIFGNELTNGKDILEDIREGKRTFLTVYALRHANLADKQFLASNLGNQALSFEAFEGCKNIIEQSGARAYAQKACTMHAQAAFSSLEQVQRGWNGTHKQLLLDLATHLGA